MYTNAPRCFLSPGGLTLTMAISRVLRLVCQAANNKFPLSVCFNHKSMFSVLDRLKINLNQVAVYSSGGLQWREVEGGELPSARAALRAAMVGDVLHVTGGADDDYNFLTSILAGCRVVARCRKTQCGERLPCRCCRPRLSNQMSINSIKY